MQCLHFSNLYSSPDGKKLFQSLDDFIRTKFTKFKCSTCSNCFGRNVICLHCMQFYCLRNNHFQNHCGETKHELGCFSYFMKKMLNYKILGFQVDCEEFYCGICKEYVFFESDTCIYTYLPALFSHSKKRCRELDEYLPEKRRKRMSALEIEKYIQIISDNPTFGGFIKFPPKV